MELIQCPKIPNSEYHQEENTLVSDNQSVVTDYGYHTFVHEAKKSTKKHDILEQIPTNTLTTSSELYLEDPDNPTPFLKAGGDKALSRFPGKPTEDINTFSHKLKIFLRHPSASKCHL